MSSRRLKILSTTTIVDKALLLCSSLLNYPRFLLLFVRSERSPNHVQPMVHTRACPWNQQS